MVVDEVADPELQRQMDELLEAIEQEARREQTLDEFMRKVREGYGDN